MLLRLAFTATVMALAVWLLREGLPVGAVVVVVAGLWLRRRADARRALAA